MTKREAPSADEAVGSATVPVAETSADGGTTEPLSPYRFGVLPLSEQDLAELRAKPLPRTPTAEFQREVPTSPSLKARRAAKRRVVAYWLGGAVLLVLGLTLVFASTLASVSPPSAVHTEDPVTVRPAQSSLVTTPPSNEPLPVVPPTEPAVAASTAAPSEKNVATPASKASSEPAATSAEGAAESSSEKRQKRPAPQQEKVPATSEPPTKDFWFGK